MAFLGRGSHRRLRNRMPFEEHENPTADQSCNAADDQEQTIAPGGPERQAQQERPERKARSHPGGHDPEYAAVCAALSRTMGSEEKGRVRIARRVSCARSCPKA